MLGDHLRCNSILTLTDLVSGRLDMRRTVGEHTHACRTRCGKCRVGGGRASPPDKPVAIPHRTRLYRSLAPPEGIGGLIETLHQRSARIGKIPDRLPIRVVDASQFDRVHAKCMGKLVHRAFERKEIWHLRRRPHEAGCRLVGANKVDLARDIQTRIHPRGPPVPATA